MRNWRKGPMGNYFWGIEPILPEKDFYYIMSGRTYVAKNKDLEFIWIEVDEPDKLKLNNLEQMKSIDLFGGYWMSRYPIARDASGSLVSLKRKSYLDTLSLEKAKEVLNTSNASSHLLEKDEKEYARTYLKKIGVEMEKGIYIALTIKRVI